MSAADRACSVGGEPPRLPAADLVPVLGDTFDVLLGQIAALRAVLAHAPLSAADGPFVEIAEGALLRMGAACDVALQLCGSVPHAGYIGRREFVAHWCCPDSLQSVVLATVQEGGAA
jgi:hypothetical protein